MVMDMSQLYYSPVCHPSLLLQCLFRSYMEKFSYLLTCHTQIGGLRFLGLKLDPLKIFTCIKFRGRGFWSLSRSLSLSLIRTMICTFLVSFVLPLFLCGSWQSYVGLIRFNDYWLDTQIVLDFLHIAPVF